jgi:hypothetical protein
MAHRSGAPSGWTWRIDADRADGLPNTFRVPPAPYRETPFARGPGYCRICGQPVFRLGWHVDIWGDGRPNHRAAWHAACVIAWKFCPPAETRPSSPLRHDRQAPPPNRRGRSSHAAVPGLARASRCALAGASRLLGRAEPSSHQLHRSPRQMLIRSAGPRTRGQRHTALNGTAAQPSRPSAGNVSKSQKEALVIQPPRKAMPVSTSSAPIAFST